MSDHKRPGGLTALAVFNFLIGALHVVSVLGVAAFLRFGDQVIEQASSAEEKAALVALQEVGAGTFAVILFLEALAAGLLIVSGIGYLKLKRFLGYVLGNAYGIAGVLSAVVSGQLLPATLGGGFDLGAIIGLIYPVLTLLLLNLAFRGDFER